MFATSKDVATYFEKTHHTVLEAVDDLIKVDPSITRNFPAIELPVKVGFGTRYDRAYEMDRDGFTMLAFGFTGEKAGEGAEALPAATKTATKSKIVAPKSRVKSTCQETPARSLLDRTISKSRAFKGPVFLCLVAGSITVRALRSVRNPACTSDTPTLPLDNLLDETRC